MSNGGGIDWGILHPISSSSSIQSSSPQANPAPAVSPNSGSDAMAQANQSMIANQANARANQLQPGLLQQQQLLNKGQSLTNQKSQMEIDAANYQVKLRQNAQDAYAHGEVKGGPEAGFDAVQEQYAKDGDPAAALALAKNREDLKTTQMTNGRQGLASVGQMMFDIQSQERPPTPPQKDPKTGQMIPGDPGVTGLDIYKQQYNAFKTVYPKAPEPSSFKDDGEFENTFVHPVLQYAKDDLAEVKKDEAATRQDKMYQANQVVKSATTDLQKTIQTNGANSQEAKDAADALSRAQQNARATAGGRGLVSQIFSSVSGTQPGTLIKQNTKGNQSNKPVELPKFDSKEEFQSWYNNQDQGTQETVRNQLGK